MLIPRRIVAKLCPEELEFFEGDVGSTQKICACASELDYVAEITDIRFIANDDGPVPDYIKDNITVEYLGRIALITSNVANTVENPIYNYEVEIFYETPLIQTQEAVNKVMAEHQEKLKNDEGIKKIEEVLAKLEKQFPSAANRPTPAPTVIKNINNPLVVGEEISSIRIQKIKLDFTKALSIIKDTVHNYFRPDFTNANNSQVKVYVNREFNKIKTLYNNDIKVELVDSVLVDTTRIIDVIDTNINNSIKDTSSNNFSEGEKYIIKTNLIELNNVLTNVYSAYIKEYDNGILEKTMNDIDAINNSIVDRCN